MIILSIDFLCLFSDIIPVRNSHEPFKPCKSLLTSAFSMEGQIKIGHSNKNEREIRFLFIIINNLKQLLLEIVDESNEPEEANEDEAE